MFRVVCRVAALFATLASLSDAQSTITTLTLSAAETYGPTNVFTIPASQASRAAGGTGVPGPSPTPAVGGVYRDINGEQMA